MSRNEVNGSDEPTEFARISEALIASGYISLDEQAKALGVHRNTAWL
jgi:hypothetical protein